MHARFSAQIHRGELQQISEFVLEPRVPGIARRHAVCVELRAVRADLRFDLGPVPRCTLSIGPFTSGQSNPTPAARS